ncbi:MAG: hypothetical protein HYV34_00005 [Candidatus Kerfeldbacteria bacterium]|nr:hypothetical protein [Candidatus Kerfeldbacteria bacterium]
MAVNKYQKIITPFLMGQRRDGLFRLKSLISDNWHIVDVPEFREIELNDADTKIERMGKIYLALSETIKQAVENK